MATTARLGIDIVGRNKTASAFGGVQRGLDSLNRSMRTLKAGIAAFAGGNILANIIRSFVEINRTAPPVAAAVNRLQASWQAFALRVGEGGLNQALINFSNRMSGLLLSTDGLAQSMGRLLAGGVNILGGVFEGVGRAIAFVYDNSIRLTRLIAVFGLVAFGQRALLVGRAFLTFASTLRAVGLAMAAFDAIRKVNSAGIIVMGLALGYVTGTLDEVRAGLDALWQQAQRVFPELGQIGTDVLGALGFDTSALTAEINGLNQAFAGLPVYAAPAATAMAKLGSPAAALPAQFKQTNEAVTSVQSAFSGFFQNIAQGTSVVKSLKDQLASLSQRLLQMATDKLFEVFLNFLAPGSGAAASGGISALLSSFGGGFASGGVLGAGKWGVAGENGPEVIRGPASIVPNGGGGAPVINIINQAPVEVQTKTSAWADKKKIDLYIKAQAAEALAPRRVKQR